MKQLNRKISVRVSMVVLVITILLVSVIFAFGSNFAVPNTFTSGSTISASQMNANFQGLSQALPAYKNVMKSDSQALTSDYKNYTSITVTPPSDGNIIFFVTAGVQLVSSNGEQGYVGVYITPTSDGAHIAGGADGYPLIADAAGGSVYGGISFTYPVAGVTAGTPVTYYITTNGVNGTGSINWARVVALFVPNALP